MSRDHMFAYGNFIKSYERKMNFNNSSKPLKAIKRPPWRTWLTHISRASLLWDIGKQYSPRCDAAERGVPSGAILFVQRNFFE